ncbi:Arf guanine nucleotide exchange factor sec74 [Psilocybe cubensis]|uniref:Arf guanine nucleotide exchange factor sec74 n=2 Tax=Psilocybe cubensis TaxID=181762 RepID=A0ACB8HFP7_PSICU|nr:Arf guanine nucleotide exchange factor sec74 [Psilocybe cubensis]KAH9486771.1 Arf guanine nucleotide exchange factor sec74 [Psilocybe cubensis]
MISTPSPSSAHPFLIPAESHMSPLKRPNVSNPHDAPSNSPPPYTQSSSSSVLLAEMTTTRTEVVTTTTTETTTHFFSLPYWKRRNGALSPASQRTSIDDLSSSITSSKSGTFPSFVDKALPPTPPEPLDTSFTTNEKRDGQTTNTTSPIYHPDDVPSQPRKVSTGTQSAAALAHAALGLGLPHVGLPHSSVSFPRPSSSHSPLGSRTSPSLSSPGVRRSKSSHRILSKRVSETQENDHAQIRVDSRRQRGLSFNSSSFLNVANSDIKGKGKDTAIPTTAPETAKKPPKPLTRKSSFWNRRKGIDAGESTNPVSDDSFVSLPPLPPVHHVSPFDVHDFQNSPNSTIGSNREQIHSTRPFHPNLSSPEILDGSKSTLPWPTSEQATTFNGVTESLQSNGTPSSYSRARRQTSTPFLHRLSLGVFSPGESSPSASSALHVYPQSATASITPTIFPCKQETPIPRPHSEEESPEGYLTRLKNAVSKSEVAGILASSSDPFHARALREYISQFDFLDIPLDVALRKLLMEVGLPRETQQIDRVMEAFAYRYMQCNSDIFVSEDHPYILAFSLIMLHTDTFNPSNKRKMTKSDYIKNTKLPGIPTEILDCFFDNIVFAPFIFIEDPVDFNGQPGLVSDVTRPSLVSTPSSSVSVNGSGSFKMGNRVDPYYLITNNLLEPLRVDVNSLVSLENPFTYEGTDGPWDEHELHQAFVNASVIEIEMPTVNRAMSLFARSPSLKSTPLVSVGNGAEDYPSVQQKGETWSLKVSKVGILNRKDDVTGSGKKSSNRKWKTWTVVLTGSQLLLFRDNSWAAALNQPYESFAEHVVSPALPSSTFRPDETFSVKDAIAVYDSSYIKHKHVMRFVLPDGRQILLQASDAKDLNEWISRINYASTFKTAGVRMRPQGLSSEDALLTGVAAATSHLHDLQKHPDHSNIARARSWDSNAPQDLMEMLSGPPADRTALKRRVTMVTTNANFDLDVPVAPEVEGAEQFKATFDQVKADLASEIWPSDHEAWLPEGDEVTNVYDSPLGSPLSIGSTNSRLPSRSQIIQSKIIELDSKIEATQNHLDADMRFIRNIAILTPFQKSTRSRLATSLQGVAKRVTQLRLEMEKLQCHRAVLRCDLSSEGRSWNYSKRVALRVAKKTLQTRRSQTIPVMSVELPKSPLFSDDLSKESPPLSQRLGSSPSDSFHSAAESGFAWPSSEDLNLLGSQFGTSRPDLSCSSSSFPKEWTNEDKRQRSSSLSSDSNHLSSNHGHEDIGLVYFDTQEGIEDDLAEEWNRTRCAQRVSLIQVPSNIMITNRLKNQSHS